MLKQSQLLLILPMPTGNKCMLKYISFNIIRKQESYHVTGYNYFATHGLLSIRDGSWKCT